MCLLDSVTFLSVVQSWGRVCTAPLTSFSVEILWHVVLERKTEKEKGIIDIVDNVHALEMCIHCDDCVSHTETEKKKTTTKIPFLFPMGDFWGCFIKGLRLHVHVHLR